MKTFKQYINEASNTITLSHGLYDELMAIEHDTVDDHSPEGKKKLADALKQARRRGTQMAMKVDDDVKQYLKKSAIPNVDDIAKDNDNSRVRRALKTLDNKL